MIYDWDDFVVEEDNEDPFDGCPVLQFTAPTPIHGRPPGSDFTIALITSFDGRTWWSWCYEMQRFLIVETELPPTYLMECDDE